MSLAGDLAGFLAPVDHDDLPPRATDYAAMLVASTLASAACGKEIVSTRIVREMAHERSGAAQATVWFDNGTKLPAAEYDNGRRSRLGRQRPACDYPLRHTAHRDRAG